jgi:hypothetical protein
MGAFYFALTVTKDKFSDVLLSIFLPNTGAVDRVSLSAQKINLSGGPSTRVGGPKLGRNYAFAYGWAISRQGESIGWYLGAY